VEDDDAEVSTKALLAGAGAGSQAAWDALVARYARLVWSVARGFRLTDADAHDVFQTTWLRLIENLDRIADPERLPGWLATTARRECIGLLRKQDREVPVFDAPGQDLDDDEDPAHPDPETATIEREEHRRLWEAFAQLSERCRMLLRVVAVCPMDSYADVSAALGIPTGSIGPTRARCLDRLRARLAA
jgi:RNA polymerase sigma factor (sigma-70 family)